MKTKKKATRPKKSSIKTIGIVGAGQMGKGIAQVAAQTGFNVIVVEPYAKTIENAKQYIHKTLDRAVEIGKINQKKKDKI
ncbi:MAG: 3-hydroxyacyl-CoA dehydrogenase NAD-binding domain-containing protein, partial [Thermodesulfobacteriota bacterium]|nr:3-hydroxyacyl-CoA dehydrogenase NAD-binding domain-containing protein [Thermodesulfobacteriota bacterium]